MNFIIAQMIGVVLTVMVLIVPHCKKMSVVVFLQVLLNLLSSVQCFLLESALVGAIGSLLSTVYTLAIFICGKYFKKHEKAGKISLTVAYLLGYVFIVIFGYQNLFDIFPLIGCSIFALSLIQKNVFGYNVCNISKTLCNIIYYVCVMNYVTALSQVFELTSSTVAIVRKIREDRKAKT